MERKLILESISKFSYEKYFKYKNAQPMGSISKKSLISKDYDINLITYDKKDNIIPKTKEDIISMNRQSLRNFEYCIQEFLNYNERKIIVNCDENDISFLETDGNITKISLKEQDKIFNFIKN